MTVDSTKAAAYFEHHGETYFFCAKGCAQKFSANPERYLNPSPIAAPAGAAGRQLDLAEHQVDEPVQEVRLAGDVVIQRHRLDPDSLAELAHAE